MNSQKVEEFAIKHGFDRVEYKGEYEGKPLYKPLHDRTVFIGMPFYILIENGKPRLVTGQEGLKILNRERK